jgi:hypothetical protein
MGIGASIFLFAAGAILTFAVQADVEGLSLDTIGIILMIVGAVGFFVSMFLWGPWATRGEDHVHTREHDHVH